MGSYMAIMNINSPIIAKALGHKSLAAAQRYQRVNFDPVREAMQFATNTMMNHAGVTKSKRRQKNKGRQKK